MMPQPELLEDIAQEYHISKGDNESEKSWRCRVTYSLLSQAGYASLWDAQEEADSSSIVHFKNRIERTLQGIAAIYPDLSTEFTSENSKVSNEIYETMIEAGCIYHTPYRISPSKKSIAQGSHCQFLRGLSMLDKRWISGIGSYRLKKTDKQEANPSFSEMFGFPTEPLSDFWDRLTKNIRWQELTDASLYEAIKTKPPYSPSYWQERLDDKGLSLARTKVPGSRLYYLYKVERGKIMISSDHFPDWLIENGNYRAISNACLASRRTLPPTSYKIDGEIVLLRIGYLYPPALMSFIRLYSWPSHYQDWPQNFRRTMSRPVFEDFKLQAEEYGYQFEEA